MKKKEKNYLDYIPVRNPSYTWNAIENGIVVIEVVRTGIFDKIAQKVFKIPSKSEIKLDTLGSSVWNYIDDIKNIGEIAQKVRNNFNDDDKVFYQRLIKFFEILRNNNFVTFKD
ncbi:PqqD family protein [Clostridium weizhouense]|uniref:PqqD family protein n=1 Tax=Clostridium weizhouense TaxID=2859781 RepID=A0ABS7APN4_9CLOT|nr:PqqD family protein [Clostridium weizhouense]MBW6410627.1 PqqD family protein [Clostridium weizhouense]